MYDQDILLLQFVYHNFIMHSFIATQAMATVIAATLIVLLSIKNPWAYGSISFEVT